MSAVDPGAAAAAWIAQVPAASRAAAAANTAWGETTGVLQLLIFLALCALVLRSGLLARLRAGLEARGLRSWTADIACTAVFGALVILAALPVAAISEWRADSSRWPSHLLQSVRGEVLTLILASLAAPALLVLIRRAPSAWGLVCGGGLGALAFAAVWLPYAQAAGPAALPPAPPGPARAGLVELVRDTHVPASDIYVSAFPGVDADVTGTAARARVVVSRGLWTRASPQELRASVGHLMGHYRHGDQLSLALLVAVLIFAAFLGVQLLAPPLARRLGLRGPGEAAALPLLAALLVGFASAGVVVDHGFIRWINVRADQFSLDNAREPDGLALTLLREWKGERIDPSPLQEALFYDHPSLKSRLIHAMSWKAAHPG